MFKKILWLLVLAAVPTLAQNAALQGHSYLGGVPAVTSGLKSSNYLNGIIPSATITVYLTGTQNKATIYADGSGTPLANPFTSNAATSVNPGGWLLFAAMNQGYDIVGTGGISPNTYPVPVTLCTDCYAGSSGGGGGSCPEGTCIQNNPQHTQTVMQPQGTTLQSNVFANSFYANLFGTGSNGIETVYGNSANCIPQGHNISDGCSILVSPLYTNADAPQGWSFGGLNFGTQTGGLQMASGASAYDYRNGNLTILSRNPINPVTGSSSGLAIRNDGDLNLSQRDMFGKNGAQEPIGEQVSLNAYAGGWDFNFYPFMPHTVNQDYRLGLNLTFDNYTDGIDFGIQEIMNHRSQGDALLRWDRLICDGGILGGSSEGCKISDEAVQEDSSVFAGTVATGGTGVTSIKINCTQDCGSQGQERLLLNTSHPTTGSFFTTEHGPGTTGTAGNSAIMPPYVTDSAASYPVSTMIQLCNAGANNGAGGAAGCTAGNQPIGVIPPVPLRVAITSGSVTSNVGTFVGTNSLVTGQTVILYGFVGNGAPLNNLSATVLSSGLSSAGFQVSVTAANITSTGAGISTQSPTGFSPAQSVVLNVVAPYTGTGGDYNGLPAGFCSSSTLQSSNSGSACYMPATGQGCLTDGVEYETVNYTYNSGAQTVTIPNMQFPHLNGVVFGTGGLCGYAVEDTANKVPSGLGTTGTIAPTYAVAGSLNATTLFYVPQRTNEEYGSPLLGLSNPSNGNFGYGAQLYFSVASFGYANNAGVVTVTIGNPPQFSGDLHSFNGLSLTFATNGDASYNGTWPVTWVNGNTFTYQPTSPTGTLPTSGTVSYNNASYTLYPAARVTSVFNTANKQVDGTLTLMPNPTTFTAGDTVRQPHYQQLNISGTHEVVTMYQPEQFLGGTAARSFGGVFQGQQTGFEIDNSAPVSLYAGYGGTHSLLMNGFFLGGVWSTDLSLGDAPDLNMFSVSACKPEWGCSSKNSSWNVFLFPALPNSVGGFNGLDALNYDPNCKSSQRATGLFSGCWTFGNNQYPSLAENGQLSFATVRAGYFVADQQINSPQITATNISTNQISAISNSTSVIGTPGTTHYQYYIVGHGIDGGSTVPVTVGLVLIGNATLDTSNYIAICAFMNPGYGSYDVLKGNTSTFLGTASPGNGATYGLPAPYACVADQGQATSAYVAPIANTMGGINAAGPIVSAVSVTAPQIVATGSSPSVALGIGGPSWTSGSAAPSGTCISGSLFSNSSGTPNTLYVCQAGAWVGK